METFETALRLMVIGQIVLTSMVLGVRGPQRVAIPLIFLQASIAAFLIKSSPALSASVPFAKIPLFLLALSAPYLVWWCANVLFDFDRPRRWVLAAFPSVTFILCGTTIFTGDAPAPIETLSISISLFVVLHAIYSIVSGSLDDLSEPRRRFRLCFVACISLVSAFVLVMELLYVGKEIPSWLPITNVVLIATVFLAISIPLMIRPMDLLPDDPTPEKRKQSEMSPADRITHNALVKAMESRAYARTGLSIRQLAEELKTPEHQLRALINSRLGYKNFSSFLNGYRVKETCDRLRDASEARIPILTIALDAGFASLAPFNRAFRNSMGMTPTEYRRQTLAPEQVVTPIRIDRR